MVIDSDRIKRDFPIFRKKINGKRLVYLDSAATTQRPKQVIDAVVEFWETKNANAAKSLHSLAEQANDEYENARGKIAGFIGADKENIIFTKNTTDAINMLMRGLGRYVGRGDKIVLTIMEHHSNFVPWQQLANEKGAELILMDIDEEGKLNEEELEKIDEAKIVAFAMASNVLGTINDTKKICKIARENGAISVVDAAQAVPGMPINVKQLGCDFLAFSGHKMLAPFGIGVLYGRKEMLEKMEPPAYGSGMIVKVEKNKSEWNEVPHRLETGTYPADSAVGLSAAIEYLEKVGMGCVREHEIKLTEYAIEMLTENGAHIIGPHDARERTGLVAFSLDGIHPHDFAMFLDKEGIAIRSGHHCAMPLHIRLGLPQGTNRASFYIYNSINDIDALEKAIIKVKRIFS